MGAWDGLSENKANLSPPVGFELGLGAELGKKFLRLSPPIPKAHTMMWSQDSDNYDMSDQLRKLS